jgi:riboflavin biosynthesis pyrimidine reductase
MVWSFFKARQKANGQNSKPSRCSDSWKKLRYVEGKDPLPVILLRKGIVSKNRKVFSNPDVRPLVICLKENELAVKEELSTVAEILVMEGNTIDPGEVLSILKNRNLNRVLLEGGPTLNYSFQKAGLIDVINLTIALSPNPVASTAAEGGMVPP